MGRGCQRAIDDSDKVEGFGNRLFGSSVLKDTFVLCDGGACVIMVLNGTVARLARSPGPSHSLTPPSRCCHLIEATPSPGSNSRLDRRSLE